jgi:hypothetical protein
MIIIAFAAVLPDSLSLAVLLVSLGEIFMKEQFSPGLGPMLVTLGVAVVGFAPAHAAERCKVMDPTGTPLNVRDQNMKVIGAIRNGQIVMVQQNGKDDNGRPWAYVAEPGRAPIGWVYREFISCY